MAPAVREVAAERGAAAPAGKVLLFQPGALRAAAAVLVLGGAAFLVMDALAPAAPQVAAMAASRAGGRSVSPGMAVRPVKRQAQ